MEEEMTRARLVATDEDLGLSLGQRYEECLVDELAGHQFFDVLGKEDLERFVSGGYKIFVVDEEKNEPSTMVYDGTNWIDDVEPDPEKRPETKYDVASVDGLMAAAELLQSEMEAVAVALQSVSGATPVNTIASMDSTKRLTRENPIQALASKLMLGRMALSTHNLFDVSNAAKAISDNESTELPTVFYEEDPRPVR